MFLFTSQIHGNNSAGPTVLFKNKITMITPENTLPPDDSQNSEADDQQSQKDIHSNGFDDDFDQKAGEQPDTDLLKQAFNAAESSFTLNTEQTPAPKTKDKKR